jgi:macrolide transport system ATP-binding/permease protein
MGILGKIANLVRRTRVDRDIDAELKAHIALRTDDNVRHGMAPDEARRDALLRFGNRTVMRERAVAANEFPLISSIASDARFAFRQLARNRGFAATAILILAIGIGSCVAIFAFVDAALIKPLPYQKPTRIVALFESMSLGSQFHISYLDYLDWKRLNQTFTALDIYDGTDLTLNTASGPQPADGAIVSDGFFRTLGVAPVLGRDFRTGEDLPSAPHTVILSYAGWQKRYGGRKDVLGTGVMLNGTSYTIVGVLPRAFHFIPVEPADFWITLHANDSCGNERGCHNYSGIARLKDGVALTTAAANMRSIADQLARQYPEADAQRGATVIPLADLTVGSLRPVLTVLLCGAFLLMAIACANAASLLLVRAEARKREVAVRGAMGASRGRLMRQLVTEGLVLAACSVLVGLATAQSGIQLLVRLVPPGMLASMPYLEQLGLNRIVVGFACILALLACLLFCLVPALRLAKSGSDMRGALSVGGRGFTGTLWRRFGSHLVAIEVAMAVVLLVAAGLLGKSFYRLLHAPIGLRADHLAALCVQTSEERYTTDAQIHALQQLIADRVATLPGVKSAGLTRSLPVGVNSGSTTFHIVGRPEHGERVEVLNREIDPGYFSTIGAEILRGRNFSKNDDASRPQVLIINQAMDKEYFEGEDPIGKKIAYDANSPPKEVVGIVADIKEGPLDASTRPALYAPLAQASDGRFFVVARSSSDEQDTLSIVISAVRHIDPNLTLSQATMMSQRIHDSPAASLHRSSAWLVGSFAAIALLLGTVGLYGVISYSVSQRTREIGVRIALGAHRGSVHRLILLEAGRLTCAGLSAGLVGSMVAGMFMRNLLFGVRVWDGSIFGAVSAVLAACALLASYLPARRAARIEPMQALRNE